MKDMKSMKDTIDSIDRKLIRDIKFTMLNINKSDIKILDDRFNRMYKYTEYNYLIKKMSKYGVICGSYSLYVYGLIDRLPKDVDLLVDRNSDIFKKFMLMNKVAIEKQLHDTNSSFNNNVDGFDCVTQFYYNNIMVDVFHDNNVLYDTYKGIKIQNPLSVIYKKSLILKSIHRDKDRKDFRLIYNRLNSIVQEKNELLNNLDYYM